MQNKPVDHLVHNAVSKLLKHAQLSIKNLSDDAVYAYTLRRAISSPSLVNVVAVSKEGESLFVVEADLEFDAGAGIVEEFNAKARAVIY